MRWEQAARQSGHTPDGREVAPAPRGERKLELVYHPAHLLEAMHQARLAAGQPSLREMEKKARDLGAGPLPRSTVADILAGFRMPSEELLVAYVQACGQRGRRLTLWRNAWARAFGADAA